MEPLETRTLLASGMMATTPLPESVTDQQAEEIKVWFSGSLQAASPKPAAPKGVHSLAEYESRIGQAGVLLEDPNVQMWVPQQHLEHSLVIFRHLTAGYQALAEIFGEHDLSNRFSVEHDPPGSPYFWGGTDGQGTIRYSYDNLVDDSPEWLYYDVPHVIGYYEEMAHCFIHDTGAPGFYEALGMMAGGETTLRAAWNPYTQNNLDLNDATFQATTQYYLIHDDGPEGVADDIWPSRVLAHVFQTEFIDQRGWAVIGDAFAAMRQDGYPLRQYHAAHKWGAFLEYLGKAAGRDAQEVFAGYGLPVFSWSGEAGYETDGVQVVAGGGAYRFRIRCFDREGTKPSGVTVYVYDQGQNVSAYAMDVVAGDAATGWVYEQTVPASPGAAKYAFGAQDGKHNVFQAVGLPTLPQSLILWADTVIDYSPGFGVGPGFNDPRAALGPPDAEPRDNGAGLICSLGREGSITLAISNHVIVDDPGDDLTVRETIPLFENYRVWVSQDGMDYIPLGDGLGDADFDLADAQLEWARFVKIEDLLPETTGSGNDPWYGVDLDALGAMHWAEIPNTAPDIVDVVITRLEQNSASAFGGWQSTPPMLGRRGGVGAAQLGGFVYVVGGTVRGSFATADLPTLEAFDLTTKTWMTKASMPTPRSDVDLVAVGNYLYAIGGRSGPDGRVTRRDEVERYDPATDTWTTRSRMPTRRNAHATVAYGGKIYVMGGNNGPPSGSNRLAVVEVYDPDTDTWSRADDMPAPADGITAAVSGERIYVFGQIAGRAIVYRYDPATDDWDDITLPTAIPFAHAAAAAQDGKIYVMGGYALDGISGKAYEYNPVENIFRALPEMPTPRLNTAAVATPQRVCAVGGFSSFWEGTPTMDCFVFQPLAASKIEEGDSATLTATFTDPDVLDQHTAVIDWGDGTTETLALQVGQRQFSSIHTYLDDNPTVTPVDRYRIRVSVRDDRGGQDAAVTTASVYNVAPKITQTQISDNGKVTVTGSFTDPGSQDQHTVVFQWHDGFSDVVVLPVGQRRFSFDHRYADDAGGAFFGEYTVIVTVMDDDGGHAIAVLDEGDGVSDAEEAFAPSGGDGNGDGIPDADQENVASFVNWTDGTYLTLATAPDNTLRGIRRTEGPTGSWTPDETDFPMGGLHFEVVTAAGSSVTATLLLPPDTNVNTYYHPRSTLEDCVPVMFDPATQTGAVLFDNRIELHLADGGRGDDDGEQNGVVVVRALPGRTARPWHNPVCREDVNNDNAVTPLDVLTLINDINRQGSRQLSSQPAPGEPLWPYLDVTGDNMASPGDVLAVINYLNAKVFGDPEAEALELDHAGSPIPGGSGRTLMSDSNCPGREELIGLALATLSSERADCLRDHVRTCQDCQAALESIQDSEDSLIDMLRAMTKKAAK